MNYWVNCQFKICSFSTFLLNWFQEFLNFFSTKQKRKLNVVNCVLSYLPFTTQLSSFAKELYFRCDYWCGNEEWRNRAREFLASLYSVCYYCIQIYPPILRDRLKGKGRRLQQYIIRSFGKSYCWIGDHIRKLISQTKL